MSKYQPIVDYCYFVAEPHLGFTFCVEGNLSGNVKCDDCIENNMNVCKFSSLYGHPGYAGLNTELGWEECLSWPNQLATFPADTN
jgi:hypothetical protein